MFCNFCSRFNEWIWASSAFEIFSDVIFKGRCTVQSAAPSRVRGAPKDSERLWRCLLSLRLCDRAIWLACVSEGTYVRLMCVYAGLHLLEWLVTEVLSTYVLLTVTQRDLHNHQNQLMCLRLGWFQGQPTVIHSQCLLWWLTAVEIKETPRRSNK